jgi:hypothetical protein
MRSVNRILGCGWTFTRIGDDQGTEDGEWLKTSTFPTSVHVELLHLKKIPDPVSQTNVYVNVVGSYVFLTVPWAP